MSRNDEYEMKDEDRVTFTRDETEALDDADAQQQATEIRESIEQTRTEMSETIEELQERLNPSYLKEQVKEQVIEQFEQAKKTVREATIGKVEHMVDNVSHNVGKTGRGMVSTIKANPIPSALIGIGLAWLWKNSRGDSRSKSFSYGENYRGGRAYDDMSRRYTSAGTLRGGQQSEAGLLNRATNAASNLASKAGDTMSSVVGQAQETAGNVASRAKETVSGVVSQAQETAGYLVDRAQYQVQRGEDSFNVAMRENPLAVGAVALALGTAVGLAIPLTSKENEWMGEARDTIVDKAQSVAEDTIEQVQQVAKKVTEEISGEADKGQQGKQGQQGEDAAQKGRRSGQGTQYSQQGQGQQSGGGQSNQQSSAGKKNP